MSSFVAFVAAIGVVTLVIFILLAMRRGWRWLWLSWLLLALLAAVALGAFNFADTLDEQLGDTPILGGVTSTLVELQEEPSIGRLGRLLESDRSTGRVRVLIWEGVLDLIGIHEPLDFPDGRDDAFNFLRPLIGYGPESMYVAYNSFYPPELATVEARNASPDRSHNETFDALVITGWLGFLVWQALYLSVFYYGFKWLGVVRSKRDRNLLIGLWILGAVGTTAVIVPLMGMPFFGVAVPFGSIIGLVLYLVYYAVFLPVHEKDESQDPFQVERLLILGLVTAVLAHYVEIHFGIAIAATRLHFFAYVALMFVVGYLLPRIQEEKETAVSPKSRRGRSRQVDSGSQGAWGPVMLHGLILLLVVGILGFQFITYSLPPDKVIQTPADLTAGEIFHQSFFINATENFAQSPFVFVMIILAWGLGSLVSLSELVKSEELNITAVSTAAWPASRRQTSLVLLLLSFLISAGGVVYSYTASPPTTVTGTLGRTLLLMWMVLSATGAAALYLQQNRGEQWQNGRFLAASIALVGLLFAIPLLIAGAVWQGLLLAGAMTASLYFLWDRSWGQTLLPAGIMSAMAIGGGLFLAFLQANLLKNSITPTTSQQFTTLEELRIFETGLVNSFLTLFYVFVIFVIVTGAFVLGWQSGSRARSYGQTPAYLSLVVLFSLAFYGISQTNLRIIQADMVFKRGKPFESQAAQLERTSQEAITAWDNTIAVYEYALDLAPREDFYYLFLGRAYLERSTIEPDPLVQRQLFEEAESRLLLAQDINPLNTDHTANLARLNTRLAQLISDPVERQERLDFAESYYQTALTLSPQNSIIRNELAAVTLDLKQDCDGALAIFDESIAIDPYFEDSYFAQANAYLTCAAQNGEERDLYYANAEDSLLGGLERDAQNERAWLQLAQIRQELGEYEAAIVAYENALQYDTRAQLPAWNINYFIALAYQELGETEEAVTAAQTSLSQAPPEVAGQVQQLLAQLGVDSAELPPINIEPETTLPEGERPLATIPPAERNGIYNTPPDFTLDLQKTYDAIIRTERGDIRLRLFDDEAPLTVNNFVFLAQQGFYDDTTFHRVLPDFMAQGGDPSGTGSGGPGYQFTDEVNNGLVFDRRGILAMANAGPNTNGSQFFITFAPTPWLDNAHTIFGEVIAGDDVLGLLTLRNPEDNPNYEGDRILRIDIEEVEG